MAYTTGENFHALISPLDLILYQKRITIMNLRRVNSDYANDSTYRRLVTGIAVKIAGGAVFYKTNF